MGQQLAEGIQKAAGAYKQYSDAKSDYNATQAMIKSPTYRKLFGLDEKGATELASTIANAQGEGGYAAANKQAESVLKYLFQTNQATQEMNARRDLANAQMAASFDRALLRTKDEQVVPLDATSSEEIDNIFSGKPVPKTPTFDPYETGYGRDVLAPSAPSPSGAVNVSPDIQRMMNMYLPRR